MKPDVVACSHHIGRWRREKDPAGNSWMTNTVKMEEVEDGKWRMELKETVQPFESEDSDSKRIWWRDGGVHQNITHAVHPDPVSGMHCWHQKVRLSLPGSDDKYGDIQVDTNRSFEIYKEWLEMTRLVRDPAVCVGHSGWQELCAPKRKLIISDDRAKTGANVE